jgi:hypothetical protein
MRTLLPVVTGPPVIRFGARLAGYAPRAADGRQSVRIDQSLPLAEAAKAHEISESGHPREELILGPCPPRRPRSHISRQRTAR